MVPCAQARVAAREAECPEPACPQPVSAMEGALFLASLLELLERLLKKGCALEGEHTAALTW